MRSRGLEYIFRKTAGQLKIPQSHVQWQDLAAHAIYTALWTSRISACGSLYGAFTQGVKQQLSHLPIPLSDAVMFTATVLNKSHQNVVQHVSMWGKSYPHVETLCLQQLRI